MPLAPRLRVAALVAAAALLAAVPAAAVAQPTSPDTPTTSRPFVVTVEGAGRPMLLIPGLTSGAGVWRGTVDHFKGRYRTHAFTLAGFAGVPMVMDSNFLPTVREALVAYIREQRLERPVLVGHSLGGFLALDVAARYPDLVGAVVNVDGLPYLPAAQMPNATPEMVRPQATMMRQAMRSAPASGGPNPMYEMSLRSMIRDTARIPEERARGARSDGRVVATAMYELMTSDLRPAMAAVKAPVLNLHVWDAYAGYGATRASTERLLADQYAALRTGTTRINDSAYHFIMLDDPAWLYAEMDRFLAGVR